MSFRYHPSVLPPLPHLLWDLYRVKICNDLHHRLTTQGHLNPTEENVFDYGLHLIQSVLMESGKTLQDYPDMPLPQQNWDVFLFFKSSWLMTRRR
jgi:hypothetical protein